MSNRRKNRNPKYTNKPSLKQLERKWHTPKLYYTSNKEAAEENQTTQCKTIELEQLLYLTVNQAK